MDSCIIPMIDYDTLLKVSSKEGFYEICEKAKINYPKTLVVNKDNYKELDIPFRTPFIGKVSNKAKYQRISFVGKEKVFLFNSKEEYRSYMKELKRLAKKDYVESRMKHYQKNQLKAIKSVYGKDSSSIIRGLKQLTPKEYLKVRAKFDLPSISYVYSDEEYDSKLEQLKSSYELINNEFNLDGRVYQQKVKRQQRRKGK